MQVSAAPRNTKIHQPWCYDHMSFKVRYVALSMNSLFFFICSFCFAWFKFHSTGQSILVRYGKALQPHGVIGFSAPAKTTVGTILLAAHRWHGINTVGLTESDRAQCHWCNSNTRLYDVVVFSGWILFWCPSISALRSSFFCGITPTNDYHACSTA